MSAILTKYLNDINARLADINKSLIYNSDIYSMDLQQVRNAVRLGVAEDLFPVGTKFTTTDGYGECTYSVVAHDFYDVYSSDTDTKTKLEHSMTLMCDSARVYTGFAQPQALFVNTGDLSHETKYYFDVLMSDHTRLYNIVPMEVENTVVYGAINEVDSSTNNIESVVICDRNRSSGMGASYDLSPGYGDATVELPADINSYRYAYIGDNDYASSRVRGILNSSDIGYNNYDNKYAIAEKHNGTHANGYLNGLSADLIDVIAFTHLPDEGNLYDRIFIPSESEIFDSFENCLPYFIGATDSDRVRAFSSEGVQYWLRDSYDIYCGLITPSGKISISARPAAIQYAVPMFNIG